MVLYRLARRGKLVATCLVPTTSLVVGLEALPEREGSFLLAGVGTRGVREALAGWLVERGWVEGRDFLLVA